MEQNNYNLKSKLEDAETMLQTILTECVCYRLFEKKRKGEMQYKTIEYSPKPYPYEMPSENIMESNTQAEHGVRGIPHSPIPASKLLTPTSPLPLLLTANC